MATWLAFTLSFFLTYSEWQMHALVLFLSGSDLARINQTDSFRHIHTHMSFRFCIIFFSC